MVPVPIRCRIPEHALKIGKDQQWVADKAGMTKQQMSDYVKLKNMPGLVIAKQLTRILNLKRIDDLHEWVWRREE